MSEIKIEKKLSKAQLADLHYQLKNSSIYIVKERPADGKLTMGNIVCKVKRILTLHSKLIVHVADVNVLNLQQKFDIEHTADGFFIYPVVTA